MNASPAVEHYRAAFERLRPALAGPGAPRAAALERFAQLGFPAAREEAWRYTSLRRLESRRFDAPGDDVAVPPLPAPLAADRLVLLNGRLAAPPPAQLAGFGLRRLDASTDAAAAAHMLRLLPGLGTERFAALNAALSPTPMLLEMPDGRRSDDLLQLTMVTAGAGPTLASPRVSVRMAAGSRGRLLLEHCGDDEHFVNAVLDVELGEGAELHVHRLQRGGDRLFQIERVEVRVGAAGRFVMRDAQLGGSLSRLDLRVCLDGRAAATELTGVFLADGTRHLDTHVLVEHRAVETASLQDYRGIAAGRGRGVFNGKSIVHEGAQKSNARQVNRNLLLTPGAEIDTKPDLEIYADDVQCSHGATTGQLDATALFYLRSRGLGEAEARSALTRAFAAAVLSRIDHAPLSRHVHDVLDERITRLLEVAP
jgi:Fe-S cluster assembly protein SufD